MCGSGTEHFYQGTTYSGYQNNRLAHKQQPADSTGFAEMCGTTSKPQPQVSRPQHSL